MTPMFIKAPAGIFASSIPKEESPRPGFEVAREITIQEIVERFAKIAGRTKMMEQNSMGSATIF